MGIIVPQKTLKVTYSTTRESKGFRGLYQGNVDLSIQILVNR